MCLNFGEVRFKSEKEKYKANIIKVGNKDREWDDIAILKLDSKLPDGVQALKLSHSSGSIDHKIKTFGFPKIKIEGLEVSGCISGRAGKNDELLHINSNDISVGFSGAPIWDMQRESVIGLVVSILTKDEYGKFENSAFAIPIETIKNYCPEVSINLIPEEYEKLLLACKKQHKIEIQAIGTKYINSLFVARKELDENFKNFIDNIEETKKENLRIRERNSEIEDENKVIREKNKKKSRDEQIPTKNFWAEKEIFNCLLFVGEAGIGKTNQLCYITEKYEDIYPIVFFSGGRILLNESYSIKNKLSEDLKTAYEYCHSYELNEIEKVAKNNNKYFIVVVDAINECLTPQYLKIHLSNLILPFKEKNIAFIISCRDIDWRFFESESSIVNSIYMAKGMDWQNRKGTILKEFNDDEFDIAWELYKNHFNLKGSLPDTSDIKRICKQPIMLRFFAEAYEEDSIPERDIKRIQIFNRYWEKKLSSTQEKRSAQAFLHTIVSEMEREGKVELLECTVERITQQRADNPNTIFTKILSESIIIYKDIDKNTKEYKIGFTYEAFFEYVIARQFLLKHEIFDEELVIKDFKKIIDKIPNYRNYMGAIEYIILLYDEMCQDVYIDLIDEFVDHNQFRDISINIITKLRDPLKIKNVYLKLADDEREEINNFVYDIFKKSLNKFSITYQTYMFEILSTRTNRKFRGRPISYLLSNFDYIPLEQKRLIFSLSRSKNNWTKASIIQQINGIHEGRYLESRNKPDSLISFLEEIVCAISTTDDALILKEVVDYVNYSIDSFGNRKLISIIDNLLKNKHLDYIYFNSKLFIKIHPHLPKKTILKILMSYIQNGDAIFRAHTIHLIEKLCQEKSEISNDLDKMKRILLDDADKTVSDLAREIFTPKINYWLLYLDIETLEEKISVSTSNMELPGLGQNSQVYQMKPLDEVCFYIKRRGIVGNAKIQSRLAIEYNNDNNFSYAHHRAFTWTLILNEIRIYLDNPIAIDPDIRKKTIALNGISGRRPIRQLSKNEFNILLKNNKCVGDAKKCICNHDALDQDV